jgi:hypothetical protein
VYGVSKMATKSVLKKSKKSTKPTPPAAKKGKAAHEKAAATVKKSKAAKKAHAVAKSAGMSKTTRDQLVAIVVEHDEKVGEFDQAKARVSELKGKKTQTEQELFRTAKELEQDDDPKGELRKKIGGLEKDRGRYALQLTDAEETKAGLKETIKACRVSVFELVRDMAKGNLLFEQKPEAPEPAPPVQGKTYRFTDPHSGIVAIGTVIAADQKGGVVDIHHIEKQNETKPLALGKTPRIPWKGGKWEELKAWKKPADPPAAPAPETSPSSAPTPAPASTPAGPAEKSGEGRHWAGLSVIALAEHAVPQSAIDALFKAGYHTLGDLEDRKIGPNGAPGRLTLIKGIKPQAEMKIEDAIAAIKGKAPAAA